MFSFKRFSILMLTAFIAVSVFAQSQNNEMSIEASYLQQTLENMIIRELSRTDSRASKLMALENIDSAIDNGNTSADVRQALEYLSMEGTKSVARENGRVVNNFPDVRRQAAKYLGKFGGEEGKNALLQICQSENEPMVLQEAIKSLGDIGINNNNETILNIVQIVRRFDNLNPDNLMAIATIDAFEKIAKKNNGLNYPEAIQLLIRISEGHYVTPVRERARQLLADLRSYSNSGKNN